MVNFVVIIKLKMDNILLKTNPPVLHYSISEANVQASQNVIYFHLVIEIPRRIIIA